MGRTIFREVIMKLSQLIICLLIIISLVACGAELPPTVTAPPTSTATPVSLVTEPTEPVTTATAWPPTYTPTSPPPPTPTNTRLPTQTPAPLPTATLPPLIQVNETLDSPVNVRSGPGLDYPVVSRFEPGRSAPVMGRSEDRAWWQIGLDEAGASGWIYGELVAFSGAEAAVPIAQASPPPPTATPLPEADPSPPAEPEPDSPEALAEQLKCGKDFCVTYQAMVPIWENGGCVGNHSIYITVLQGPPPGEPMDGVVIGDTYNNVEVASGSHGPGRTEITLWNNSMTLVAKRHIDGTPYTSEESFNFTAHDELIPAEVLAANGYCEGSVEKCRDAQQHNQVCRGHYSWRVTFHKFD